MMAAVNASATGSNVRHATVFVDYVRTATAAGMPPNETVFPKSNARESEADALEDLEERIRRATVHHLNDIGVPVSARRPFSVEATPEIPFVISAARLAFKYLPLIYGQSHRWLRNRQLDAISSYYQTAAITINLGGTFDYLKPSVIASIPSLERKLHNLFPCIKAHLWITWVYHPTPTSNSDGNACEAVEEHYSLAISADSIWPNTIIKLLKKLDTERGGTLRQNLVALKGRRWKSMFLNRVWVLPQNHSWARERMHIRR